MVRESARRRDRCAPKSRSPTRCGPTRFRPQSNHPVKSFRMPQDQSRSVRCRQPQSVVCFRRYRSRRAYQEPCGHSAGDQPSLGRGLCPPLSNRVCRHFVQQTAIHGAPANSNWHRQYFPRKQRHGCRPPREPLRQRFAARRCLAPSSLNQVRSIYFPQPHELRGLQLRHQRGSRAELARHVPSPAETQAPQRSASLLTKVSARLEGTK